MSLLSTLAAHDLGYLRHRSAAGTARRDAAQRREPRALPGTSPELVRHRDARAAPSAVCLHRGQRQPRGRAPRARSRGCSSSRPSRRRWRSGSKGWPTPPSVLRTVSASSSRRIRHAPRDLGDQQPGAGHRRRRPRARRPDDRVATTARVPARAPGGGGGARSSGTGRRPPTSAKSPTGATRCSTLSSISPVNLPVARARRGARRQDARPGRRDALRLPLRPAPPHLRDRLPPGRRGRPGPLRRRVLRPARLRGAPRQLRRDRQGRRAAAPLVPPRPPRHQRERPRRADLVGRHDVRVPDAAAPDAQLPGHAARSELPRRGAAADRLRPASAACRGGFRNRPTPSPIARAPISTGRSACRASA